MYYISKESANNFYKNLYVFHNIDFIPATKVSTLKNVLENEVLAETTGIQYYHDKYKDGISYKGQKTWLQARLQKLDRNENAIKEGIPKHIITGIDNLFAQRNIAEHEKDISPAAYYGIFDIMVKSIECFSGTPLPDEIKAICNLESKKEQILIPKKKQDEESEIKRIERRIPRWFKNKEQINSIILYSYLKLFNTNNNVTYNQLKEESEKLYKEVNKTDKENERIRMDFKGNFDSMMYIGKNNHGKIFEKYGQNVFFWERVKDIIFKKYKEYVEKK